MEKSILQHDFNVMVNTILHSGQSRAAQTQCLQKLAQIMTQVTDISAFHRSTDREDRILNSGLAISPIKAANCFLDGVRTVRFWQGIKEAIADLLTQKKELKILYAGSGPYGSILLPILPLFQNAEIKVTVLDIYQQNVASVKSVIEFLDISNLISKVCCSDATLWQPEVDETQMFDLIISETMTNFLVDEPQVHIFSYLQRFLNEQGSLIPQEICLSMSAQQVIADNTIIASENFPMLAFDRTMAERIGQENPNQIQFGLNLSADAAVWNRFLLHTEITVYKNHRLTVGDSLITNDIHIEGFSAGKSDILSCRYELAERPTWHFDFPGG